MKPPAPGSSRNPLPRAVLSGAQRTEYPEA